MTFRKHTANKRKELEQRIEETTKTITSMQHYLLELQQELKEGVWVGNLDYSKLPKPKPHCYICLHKLPATNACSTGSYGTVCEHYQHFTGKIVKSGEDNGR